MANWTVTDSMWTAVKQGIVPQQKTTVLVESKCGSSSEEEGTSEEARTAEICQKPWFTYIMTLNGWLQGSLAAWYCSSCLLGLSWRTAPGVQVLGFCCLQRPAAHMNTIYFKIYFQTITTLQNCLVETGLTDKHAACAWGLGKQAEEKLLVGCINS